MYIEKELKEAEVVVSVTLSKSFKVEVADYTTEKEKNEDGSTSIYYDFSDCDLKQAVEDQILLPQDAHKYVNGTYRAKDLEGWNVDDFEVVLE